MTQSHRLETGGRIDRSKPIYFHFNGKRLMGYQGDTIASALLANNVKLVSRSFKFHRPRGILAAGVEDTNGLLTVDFGRGEIPSVRAAITPLIDGMQARSQNCFPSVHFDLLRVFDYSKTFWAAGFYNKIFKWPNWHTWETLIRRIAGLGKLPAEPDPSEYTHLHSHCDVLVVGGGPAGIVAGIKAAREGKDVLLVERDSELGGSLLYNPREFKNASPADFLFQARTDLTNFQNVRVLLRSTAVAFFDDNLVTIHDQNQTYESEAPSEILWKVKATKVVLATGAIDQPLIFGNNDLPGVMLTSAVLEYASRYAVQCGSEIVGVVNNNLGLEAILSLPRLGLRVIAVIDSRIVTEKHLANAASKSGIRILNGCIPLRAAGSSVVKKIFYRTPDGDEGPINCDHIAMSGGLNPTAHLYSQAGGKLRYDEKLACFVPGDGPECVRVVGAANGNFTEDSDYKITERQSAPVSSNQQWIDYLHDVTLSDIELSVRENLHSVEHLKRYTTTGMAVDQGKTSNLNALTLFAQLHGKTPAEIGTTTFRPMFMPVTFGALAGNRSADFYDPPRLLPSHDWHISKGAVLEDYGSWRRPAFYGTHRQESIERETLLVRRKVGMFDGSPLGKIEVKGPDAAEFLNRIYVNTVHTLRPGRVRYGIMLNENGVVLDDGVFARVADDHFLVYPTSGHAEQITNWLEEWHQCEWPSLELVMTPVTSQWAMINLAGPLARDLLSKIPGMIDLSNDAFPHMSCHSGLLGNNISFRIQRVSFTGELSYELSVPSTYSNKILETLWAAGQPLGLGMFGVEALMVLRLEKGFIHVGGDTDGTTNAFDIGFQKIIKNKSSDFIGMRSLKRASDLAKDRRQLVGLALEDANIRLRAGAHIVTTGKGKARQSQGFVTSAEYSPTLGKTVALGLIERGFEREGEVIHLFDQGKIMRARITPICAFDAEGTRIRG